LLAEFDVEVVVCASLGGETGTLLSTLIPEAGVTLASSESSGWNGGYAHDRRSGERRVVATMSGAALTRHEIDDRPTTSAPTTWSVRRGGDGR